MQTKTIWIIGDSWTLGVPGIEDSGFGRVLADRGHRVINRSIEGWSNSRNSRELRLMLAGEQPDMVIAAVTDSAKDWLSDQDLEQGVRTEIAEGWLKQSRRRGLEQHLWDLNQQWHRDCQEISREFSVPIHCIGGSSPLRGSEIESWLELLIPGSRDTVIWNGCDWLETEGPAHQRFREWGLEDQFRAAQAQWGQKRQLMLNSDLFAADGLHPTQRAHEIIADLCIKLWNL